MYILYKTVDRDTINTVISANKLYLIVALLVVFLAWTWDAARFCALARSAQEKVSFKLGLILTWVNYFACAVTPMQTGGGPVQVYMIYKRGIPIGKGIAITMMRTMLTVLLLTLIVPLSLVIDPSIINQSSFVKGIVGYVFAVVFLTWGFIAFTIFRPDLVKKLGKGITIWLKRFKIIKKERILPWSRWISRETDNYSLNIKLSFTVGKWEFLLAVLCSGLHLITIFSVLPCLMLAMGMPFNYTQTILTQAIFMFAIYFIPTPGASGVAEVGGAAIFTTLMAENMAGVMAILWRFFTEYISIIMGIVIVIRIIGWGVTESIHKASNDEESEEGVFSK
jgi:uncharacterized protein (TIRG00374 family)